MIGRKGTIDKPMFMADRFWPIDTTFYCFARQGYSIYWMFYVLQAIDWRSFNEASGVPSLSRDTIRAIPMVAPQFDEQVAISKILDSSIAEIAHFNSTLTSLRAEKRALMQQLLTGKRRVKL